MRKLFYLGWLVPVALLGLVAYLAQEALASANMPQAPAASIAMGGKLYDTWWKAAGAPEPKGNHPLWALQTTNTRTGSVSWRCKECHGWDYLGKDGAYGSGSRKTGFVGVYSAGKGKDWQELTAILKGSKNPGHNFATMLDDKAIGDLVNFLKEGLFDTKQYVDYATKKPKGANVERGRGLYSTVCAACHGPDGTRLNFGTEKEPEYVGTVAVDNPQEFLHKVMFGQPGTPMPSGVETGWKIQDAVDVLGHAQSLPTGEEPAKAPEPAPAVLPKTGGPFLVPMASMVVLGLALLALGWAARRTASGKI